MTGMKISAMAFAWYKREDYPRILQIMIDADKLHRTFDDWEKAVNKHVADIEAKGDVKVVRAMIEPETFLKWCGENGMLPDAKARMRYGNEAAAKHVRG